MTKKEQGNKTATAVVGFVAGFAIMWAILSALERIFLSKDSS